MSYPRIPFEKAIADSRLLKNAYETFSPEQKSVLKICYGLELDNADLAIFHALHGGGVYDSLFQLLSVHDSGVKYEHREYTDITLILGRRAAKSCLGHFMLDYEALCGGHKQRLVNKSQNPVFLHISQDLKMARKGMREYSLHYLKESVAGREILGDLKRSVTMNEIRLEGLGEIVVGAPNIKVGRGASIPCVVMDEIAVWASDEKSASPDFEVERAVSSAMSQFGEFAKKIKLSTPMTEEGLLWQMQQIGTHGRFLANPEDQAAHKYTLVLQGPSPVLRNPSITKVFLQSEKAKDPIGFQREIGAQFAKSVTSYLPSDLVHRAVQRGLTKRPPKKGVYYCAAMDPAFRGDAIPLCIGHLEEGGVFVQDLVTSWRGKSSEPLNPGLIMPLIGDHLKEYGVTTILSDQHHLDSLSHIAEGSGFFIEPFTLGNANKLDIWRNALTLLYQDKMRLLDHAEQTHELLSLERIISKMKVERIQGKRDDHAIVLAMCAHRALQLGIAAPKADEQENEPTTKEGVAIVRASRWGQRTKRSGPKPAVWWNR